MSLLAAARFPPPQFTETGHQLPALTGLPPRAVTLEYLDVAVLMVTLLVASWLALQKRSRTGIMRLGIFSLVYFGFWRKGCVCSIGSIQNIAQAMAQPSFAIPVTVVAFGLLPLAFALVLGRVFCAGVCPHGALQDLMLVKPVTVPPWLEHGLRMLAYTYLGLAIVFAATGGGYIICQYDPFVPIFRFSGSLTMVLTGVVLLLIGMFVGRPYCRFLCPYGVLLGLASRLSKWRIRITPDTCTQCRLCEQSCPFGAINKSTVDAPTRTVTTDKRRLAVLLVLAPALVALGVWTGGSLGTALARKHPRVSLAEQLHLEETGVVTETTDAATAYRATGEPVETVYTEAVALRRRYVLAGRLCGAWVGLVIGLKLVGLAIRRRRNDYEADQGWCVACARCYEYCPQEHLRRQTLYGIPVPGEIIAKAAAAGTPMATDTK